MKVAGETDRFILGIGLMVFLIFCATSLTIYELKNQLQEKEKKIINLQDQIDQISTTLLKNDKRLNKNHEKITILEQSIEPNNQRWAKIKKVRSIVQNELKRTKKTKLSIKEITVMASSIVDYPEEYDVPISYIAALIKRESAFDPKAISKVGAIGLMQLMPDTASECASDIGKKYYNIYNIKDNIQLGVWYFAKMLNRFDHNYNFSISAYNCGSTCVEKVEAGNWSKYPDETILYLENVLKFKNEFEMQGL